MISIFATSIRPRHWKPFYENIQQATKRPFEIVFTSPKPPLDGQPDNFKIVSTNVAPGQALEAASRACTGDFMVQAVDDVRYSIGALDIMADLLEKQEKVIASPVYWIHGVEHLISHREGIFGSCGEFPQKATNPPLAPVCPMIRTADYRATGGYDPCFCAQYCQHDLYYRLISSGWTTVLVNAKVTEDSAGSDLWRNKGQGDLRTCRQLWRDPETCNWTGSRLKPVDFYDDATILTKDQGYFF
ncbi:MAG: hypothetical protein ACYSUV_00430 [Planctomycetota bacterium]|jgi:hypothetical protein